MGHLKICCSVLCSDNISEGKSARQWPVSHCLALLLIYSFCIQPAVAWRLALFATPAVFKQCGCIGSAGDVWSRLWFASLVCTTDSMFCGHFTVCASLQMQITAASVFMSSFSHDSKIFE